MLPLSKKHSARISKPDDKYEPTSELEEIAYDFWGSYWGEIVSEAGKRGGGIYEFVAGMIPDLADASDVNPDRLFSTILAVGEKEGWILVGKKNIKLRVGRTMRRLAVTKDEAIAIGESIGIDWDEVDFDPEDLVAGIKVEFEHGSKVDERVNITKDDLDMTAQIAWAHLMEDPDYYIMLDTMEGEMDNLRTPELREKEGQMKRNKSTQHLALSHSSAKNLEELRYRLQRELDSLANDDEYDEYDAVYKKLVQVEDEIDRLSQREGCTMRRRFAMGLTTKQKQLIKKINGYWKELYSLVYNEAAAFDPIELDDPEELKLMKEALGDITGYFETLVSLTAQLEEAFDLADQPNRLPSKKSSSALRSGGWTDILRDRGPDDQPGKGEFMGQIWKACNHGLTYDLISNRQFEQIMDAVANIIGYRKPR